MNTTALIVALFTTFSLFFSYKVMHRFCTRGNIIGGRLWASQPPIKYLLPAVSVWVPLFVFSTFAPLIVPQEQLLLSKYFVFVACAAGSIRAITFALFNLTAAKTRR